MGIDAPSRTQACPQCGAALVVDEGWVTWCDACDWNVRAATPMPRRGPTARLVERVGERLGDRLAAELARSERLEPRLTPATAAAFALAAAIHLVTLALLAAAAYVVVATWLSVPLLVLALAMLGFAWLIRPRLGRVPEQGVVSRAEAPALFALADAVASQVRAPGPDVIVLDETFNASWHVAGARRRRVMTLGLPALAALAPQQRVALVAHEVAHGRNGDVRRGLFVGSAIETLAELYSVLLPGPSSMTYSELGIVDMVARGLLWVVARPVGWLLALEYHLLMRDMQRAEYLADALAAEVAGTVAVAALHETMLLGGTVHHVVHEAAHRRIEPEAIMDTIAERIPAVPERERRRVRRAAALEKARLDETHPPTALRIQLLEERPAAVPALELDEERSRRIDAELAAARRDAGRRLAERYRDALYG